MPYVPWEWHSRLTAGHYWEWAFALSTNLPQSFWPDPAEWCKLGPDPAKRVQSSRNAMPKLYGVHIDTVQNRVAKTEAHIYISIL